MHIVIRTDSIAYKQMMVICQWPFDIRKVNNQPICTMDYWKESPLEKTLLSQTADTNEQLHMFLEWTVILAIILEINVSFTPFWIEWSNDKTA